jgi:hypothetical protein
MLEDEWVLYRRTRKDGSDPRSKLYYRCSAGLFGNRDPQDHYVREVLFRGTHAEVEQMIKLLQDEE